MKATDIFDPRPEALPSRLDLALEVMRDLSRATDPQEMYRVFTRRMADALPVDRHVTLTRRGLKAPDVRVIRYSRWPDDLDPWAENDRLPVLDRGLFADLVAAGRAQIIENLTVAADDPSKAYLEGQRSLVAIPLFEDGEATDLVILTREAETFPVERLPDLVWMCNLFGRATRAGVLTHQLRQANDQAQHEMLQIAKLQRALLPADLPRVSTLDLAAYSRSTATAGGDYYDVVQLPRGRLGLLVADVCGHGASAAMLVAVVHSLVKTYTGPALPPGHLLSYVNDHLTRMYTRSFGTFVTAVYAVYDPDRGSLTWANAGHPPPRLVRADGSRQALKGRRCVPLGIVDGTEYPEDEIALKPGDVIMLHTDGVTDAKGQNDEAFGTDRLDKAIYPGPAGARTMLAGVLAALEEHTGGAPPTDDYTMLAMKFVRSRKKAGEVSGEFRAVGK
ncbi:MAG TPA: PP2C family protein-serine/threonine phosphatase [Gemmataceae bacterium]|nr:PP2C family protein-serine/threonine phosphatase [Gemmataceae bacterium]